MLVLRRRRQEDQQSRTTAQEVCSTNTYMAEMVYIKTSTDEGQCLCKCKQMCTSQAVVFVSELSLHSLVYTSQMHTSNTHPAWLLGVGCPTSKTDSANNRLALKGGEESPKILHSTEKRWRENYLPKKYDDF